MQRVLFSSTNTFTPFESVPVSPYGEPSVLDEFRSRMSSQGPDDLDFYLESVLTRHLRPLPTSNYQKSLVNNTDIPWNAFVARFMVHFGKGVFAGAGMYTMQELLVTRRLQIFIQWIYHGILSIVFRRQED